MAGYCKHAGCTATEDGVCLQGNTSPKGCPKYVPDPLEELLSEPDQADRGAQKAWPVTKGVGGLRSGLGLGIDEVRELQAKQHAEMVGIIGLPGTGKTSYLIGLYSLILNLKLLPEFLFADSRTLPGFELRAKGLRKWQKGALEGRIVGRTSTFVREPSFLHVNFVKGAEARPLCLLFSDLPGEWFETLITKPNDVREKIGFISECTSLLVTVDGPAITPPEKIHGATSDLRHLLLRTKAEFSRAGKSMPPVAIAVTKCDALAHGEYAALAGVLEQSCGRCLENFRLFQCAAVSYHPEVLPVGSGVKESLEYLTLSVGSRAGVEPRRGSVDRTFRVASSCNVQF
jgi:hypothetical protein